MSDTLVVERLAAAIQERDCRIANDLGETWPPDYMATSYVQDADAILAADPALAEALSTGLALQSVQEALPEGWSIGAITPVWSGSSFVEWHAYALGPYGSVGMDATGPTIEAALLALVDALNKEKGR